MSNFYQDIISVRKKRENNAPNTIEIEGVAVEEVELVQDQQEALIKENAEQVAPEAPEPKKKGSGKKDDESKAD